jgi:uncharacterized protein (UPF0332 family)
MNLSDLLSRRIVEQVKPDPQQIREEMAIAKRDIASAKKMLQIQEWEWAHNAAYNAMLQAGRALMFSKGYRHMSQEHHVAVVSFMQAVYANKLGEDLIHSFDKARRKRSESLYDRAGSISEGQGINLVARAEEFVSKAAEILKT